MNINSYENSKDQNEIYEVTKFRLQYRMIMPKLSDNGSMKVSGTLWVFNKYLLILKYKSENKKAKLGCHMIW